MVRLAKRGNTSDNDISIHTIRDHFSEKFIDNGQCDSDVHRPRKVFGQTWSPLATRRIKCSANHISGLHGWNLLIFSRV